MNLLHAQEEPFMKKELREYFAKIGALGGKKSKRKLTRKQALAMLAKRKDRQKKS